jgi:hypothetical protein
MTEELLTGYWNGDVRETDHLGYLVECGIIILKWIFRNWEWGMIWLIGTGVGLL